MKVYMKYLEDCGYMSIVESISDIENTFLSRREIKCNFTGLGGNLQKLEAVDIITKEFKLDGKLVIPVRLQCEVGKPGIKGMFYVYEDEGLAKKHVNPTVFARLEKAKTKLAEKQASEQPAQNEADVKETPQEKTE